MLTKDELMKKSPAELRKMASDLGNKQADELGKPELVEWINTHQNNGNYTDDELNGKKAAELRTIATSLGCTDAEELGKPELIKFIKEHKSGSVAADPALLALADQAAFEALPVAEQNKLLRAAVIALSEMKRKEAVAATTESKEDDKKVAAETAAKTNVRWQDREIRFPWQKEK